MNRRTTAWIVKALTAWALIVAGVTQAAKRDDNAPTKTGLPKGCAMIYPKGDGWPVNGVFVPRRPGQTALVLCTAVK